MAKGIVKRSGLRTLVEKSCSKRILKIKVNKEGAYSNVEVSIWAGVINNKVNIINNSKKYFLLIFASIMLIEIEAIE